MAVVDLYNGEQVIDTSLDNVVIVNMFECSPSGGRSLDVTGFKPTVIKAGHVIMKESATNEYKPMPVNEAGDAYAALPSGHSIVGVAYSSALTRKPFMTIMVRGTVNQVASPYPVTDAVKTALPLIRFTQD